MITQQHSMAECKRTKLYKEAVNDPKLREELGITEKEAKEYAKEKKRPHRFSRIIRKIKKNDQETGNRPK